MNNIKMLIVITAGLLVSSFIMSVSAAPSGIKQQVNKYFEIYAQRKDFAAFMDFYAEDAVLEDIIYGGTYQGRNKIREFLNWQQGPVTLADNTPSLVIQQQVIEGNKVVAKGYFNRFNYAGKEMGPWRFVIWLEFNQQDKIIKHVDWINYTPRESFLGGPDMNKNLPGFPEKNTSKN